MKFVLVLALFLSACVTRPAPQSLLGDVDYDLIETRYCGSPKRDANGTIIRRSAVVTAYWRQHVCPTTGLYKAPCPDYALNHILPLACGGCDSVSNLTAMRVDAKKIVDGYERKIFAANPPFPDTAACPPLTKPLPLLAAPTP